MNIDYYKKYEPIDGKWYINKKLGSGAFGTVFEIERRDFTNDKSALKIISIPSSSGEVENYREENYDLDEKSVSSYFYGFVEEFIKEFQLMTKLKGNSNIVSIEDYDVKEHADEIGWDILIRMELLTPMNKYFAQNPPTIRDVIKLGIDICKALEVCQKFNIVHRDIKPSNIFVSETGEYKLGDFGVARTLEKTSSGLSKKGTYTYMAPEVYKGDAYGSNVDIYSLGIVMYKLLNNNKEPFKLGYTHEDEENALVARMKNTPMPSPENAEGRLAEIILKACSFEPKDRYESPIQMREELESILYIENEGKIIFPQGDKLEYEPSDIHEKGDETSGLFDEKKKFVDEEFEDDATRGIFDEKGQNDSEEQHQATTEGTEKASGELSPKGILITCSIVLLLIIAIIWGTASRNTSVLITEAYVTIEAPIVGETPAELDITSDHPEQYGVVLDYCYYHDSNTDSYVDMTNSDVFEYDREYSIRFHIIPNEGYHLNETTVYKANNEETICYGTDDLNNDSLREIDIVSFDPTIDTIDFTYDWSKNKISLNGYDAGYRQFDKMIPNCISFITEFGIETSDTSSPHRNWNLYIKKSDGNFYKVNTFYYSEEYVGENRIIQFKTQFEQPTSFDAIAIVPSENVQMNWTNFIDVKNVLVKK